MKLMSHNLGGNIHDAVAWINKYRLEHFFVQVAYVMSAGNGIIIILRVPDDFDLKSHCGKILNPRKKK